MKDNGVFDRKPEKKRPNILWFITDDTDFSMLGFSGGNVLTPNIDNIATRGVKCTRFYTVAAACTPSRYAYLTGHYAGRCPGDRFQKNNSPDEPSFIGWNTELLPEKERNLAHLMQAGGYITGFAGKWHCGPGEKELGIDYFERDDDPVDPEVDRKLKEHQQVLINQMHRNGFEYAASISWANPDSRTIRKLQYHNLEWICQGALDFLDQYGQSEKPFFLNIATSTIHGPCHIESLKADERLTGAGYKEDHLGCMPPRDSIFKRLKEAEGVELNHRSAGALWTDDLVGIVLEKLRELNLSENTVVVFSTDHNAFDGKATCYEGGVHIPYIMKWPGEIPAGSTCQQLIQNIDFLPTILDIAGISVADDMIIDGESRLNYITGKEKIDNERDDIYFEFEYTRGITDGKWKYIGRRYPAELLKKMKKSDVKKAPDLLLLPGMQPHAPLAMARYPYYFDPDQLYDLENDPDEQNNLAYDPIYQDILAEMKDRLQKYLDSFESPFNLDNVDEFLFSDKFKEMAQEAKSFDMNQFEWYRKGWY